MKNPDFVTFHVTKFESKNVAFFRIIDNSGANKMLVVSSELSDDNLRLLSSQIDLMFGCLFQTLGRKETAKTIKFIFNQEIYTKTVISYYDKLNVPWQRIHQVYLATKISEDEARFFFKAQNMIQEENYKYTHNLDGSPEAKNFSIERANIPDEIISSV